MVLSPNFMGVAISVMCVLQSRFFHKAVTQFRFFFSRLRKSRSTDLFIFFYVSLNDILEPALLELAFKTLGSLAL